MATKKWSAQARKEARERMQAYWAARKKEKEKNKRRPDVAVANKAEPRISVDPGTGATYVQFVESAHDREQRIKKTVRHMAKVTAASIVDDIGSLTDAEVRKIERRIAAAIRSIDGPLVEALNEIERLTRNQGRAFAEVHITAVAALKDAGMI